MWACRAACSLSVWLCFAHSAALQQLVPAHHCVSLVSPFSAELMACAQTTSFQPWIWKLSMMLLKLMANLNTEECGQSSALHRIVSSFQVCSFLGLLAHLCSAGERKDSQEMLRRLTMHVAKAYRMYASSHVA